MEDYVREKITQLRLSKGISEYKLSYDLGHSRGYINNISSGKALPSMSEFFYICEYFGITPSDFFDNEHNDPILLSEIRKEIRTLDDDDLLIILTVVKRLKKQK